MFVVVVVVVVVVSLFIDTRMILGYFDIRFPRCLTLEKLKDLQGNY